jgi:GDP-L-fucose synthase
MHFIFDLIRKIMRGKLYGDPVILWGDGYQKRELVFIDDFVRIMLQSVDKCENDLINVGAGEEFTIRHFAQLICGIVGYDFGAIQFDTTQYVGAKSKCLDITKMINFFPGFKSTPIEVGLEKTIKWFTGNKELLNVK